MMIIFSARARAENILQSAQDSSAKYSAIRLYYPLYNFLDQSPMLWLPYSLKNKTGFISFGVSYIHIGESKFGYHIADDLFAISSYLTHYKNNRVPIGQVNQRTQNLLRLEGAFQVFSHQKTQLAITSGVMFRSGFESQVIDYPRNFEIRTVDKYMIDFGLGIGSQISYDIFDKCLLTGEIRYGHFLYRYDTGGRAPQYPYANGTTKSHFSINIMFGWKIYPSSKKQLKKSLRK